MITLINRFSKYSIVLLGFLAITLSHAQDDRAEDISILDVDANGEVDALTDGLLLLRSMFGLTDDVLITGAVSDDATISDSKDIDSYITSIKGKTFGELTSGTGPAGPQGAKGDKGDKGDAGATGATGAQGIQGIQGATGDTGATGAAGADGSDGATGDTGATGAAGADGSDGATGDTGATGAAGADGSDGATGDTGATGAAGADGSDGATGPKGDTGATGAAGADGSDGATGDTGATGAAGADGSDGATGPKGDTGATGAAGADGSDGATGDTGATGAAGADGSDGATGPKGDTGATGAAGADGSDGATGPKGDTGATGADGRGLAWVSASSNVNGYWFYGSNQVYMAVQISGSDLVYTSPYDPEDGSVLNTSRFTVYVSENCQGMAYVENGPLSELEFAGSGYLVKRTSQKGGTSITANSYYGQYNGVYQCVNAQASGYITSSFYETEQTSLLMSTYQQSHTLRWSN